MIDDTGLVMYFGKVRGVAHGTLWWRHPENFALWLQCVSVYEMVEKKHHERSSAFACSHSSMYMKTSYNEDFIILAAIWWCIKVTYLLEKTTS